LRFWQKYSFFEHGFGEQPVLFVLSDNYEELFVEGGSEIDVCLLDNIQKNLDSGNGQFAIDELRFSINELAGKENDLNALSFIKQASDITKNRYCALFMNDAIDLASILFIGKISDKFSRDDIIWSGGQFAVEVYPAGEYKFTAHSFDLSLLEKIKLNSKIDLPDGTKANSIYERIQLSEWQAIFENRLSFQADSSRNFQFAPLGDLGKVIGVFLSHTTEALFDLTGTQLSFVFLDTYLSFKVNPALYNINLPSGDEMIVDIAPAVDLQKKLKISMGLDVGYGADWSRIFINRKIVDPSLGYPEIDNGRLDRETSQIQDEQIYSFKQFDNIAELLSAIAKALGCYLYITYETSTTILLEFKPRAEINELELTYIEGVSDANLDTSSMISSEATQFYATANNIAVEGDDIIQYKTPLKEPPPFEETENFIQLQTKLASIKEKKNAKIERILLSLSPTREQLLYPKGVAGLTIISRLPLNIFTQEDSPIWNMHELKVLRNNSAKFWVTFYEMLHSALYVMLEPFEEEQIQRLGTTPIWRPAMRVYIKHNNDNLMFENLSDYINYLIGRDEHYYETEYSLTVPFWNGFSKNADGTDANWKNVKLGSQVKIKEKLRDYIADEWQEVEAERIYTVIGIEINLQKPETKLKLQNSERFSFSDWNGNIGELPGYISAPIPNDKNDDFDENIKQFQIAEGETILKGDAVQIVSEGLIIKARSFSGYYGKICGIALQAGGGGDIISVQTAGEVYCEDYQFADVSKMVWCRTNGSGSNINEQILSEPNYTEDLILKLGKSTGEHSFMLDIAEVAFEGGVLPPPM